MTDQRADGLLSGDACINAIPPTPVNEIPLSPCWALKQPICKRRFMAGYITHIAHTHPEHGYRQEENREEMQRRVAASDIPYSSKSCCGCSCTPP